MTMLRQIFNIIRIFATWVSLSKIRNSFLSKATTALSLATFGLANLTAPLYAAGVDLWRLKFLFVGALSFLCGYAVILFRIPPEFRDASDPDSVVDRMLRVHGWEFFQSRLKLTKSIVERYITKQDAEIIKGPYVYAKKQVSIASQANESNWKDHAASLYHSDLLLRQFDRPKSRYFSMIFLVLGIIFLIIPTLQSVYHAFVNLN